MASTNVVRLPTAAKRKVTQRSVVAARLYRRANPWPGQFRWRWPGEDRDQIEQDDVA